MTADTAVFWDATARKYAASPIKDMAGYERTVDRTAELIRRLDSVLEIGCGTGMTARQLAPHVRNLLATDISPAMVGLARDKAIAEAIGNAHFDVAAAEASPLPDSSQDAVLAFNLLHLVADRSKVLADIWRVLKPGGLLITKTPCLSQMNLMIRLAVPVMQRFGKAPHVAFFNAEQLEADIMASGFMITERGYHGSGRKDARIFLVARKP